MRQAFIIAIAAFACGCMADRRVVVPRYVLPDLETSHTYYAVGRTINRIAGGVTFIEEGSESLVTLHAYSERRIGDRVYLAHWNGSYWERTELAH